MICGIEVHAGSEVRGVDQGALVGKAPAMVLALQAVGLPPAREQDGSGPVRAHVVVRPRNARRVNRHEDGIASDFLGDLPARGPQVGGSSQDDPFAPKNADSLPFVTLGVHVEHGGKGLWHAHIVGTVRPAGMDTRRVGCAPSRAMQTSGSASNGLGRVVPWWA